MRDLCILMGSFDLSYENVNVTLSHLRSKGNTIA